MRRTGSKSDLPTRQLSRAALPLAISTALALSVPLAARASIFPAEFDLAMLDGSNGLAINGETAGDQLGYSVSEAGDINGDGIDDLILAAPTADPGGAYSGRSYVLFGADGDRTHPLDLSSLDGSNGFVIDGGATFQLSGRSVSAAGDLNGDGVDDLVIGAPAATGSAAASGRIYVVFGATSGLPSMLNLNSLNGTNGFVINGESANDYAGRAVSAAGDINGDGIDDLLIGVANADVGAYADAGRAYVVFGSSAGLPNPLNLSSLNGTNGFVLNGAAAGDLAGTSVRGAGDVNGDTIDDLIIGAPGADPNGESSGRSYVVFGSDQGLPGVLTLSALDGSNGFVINGELADDQAGQSVGALDFNGDGVNDVLIGAVRNDMSKYSGRSYVIYGSTESISSPLELSALNGSNGFVIEAAENSPAFRWSVDSAGDVNGDGIDDLIIGEVGIVTEGVRSGGAYLVFGSKTAPSTPFDLGSLNGTNGFLIKGAPADLFLAVSVSSSGDFNGDGLDDVIIGAPANTNDPNKPGNSYLVFGRGDGLFTDRFEGD